MELVSVGGDYFLSMGLLGVIVFSFSLFSISKLRNRLFKRSRENEKLMFLFTEVNPTPIIRTDETGVVVYCNEEAKKELSNIKILGLTLGDIFPELEYSKTSFGSSVMVSFEDKHYSMEARYLDVIDGWQFYFYNVTKQVRQEESSKKSIRRKILNTDISKLTKREKQVLDLVNNGFTSTKIATELKCSKRTVTTHRYNLTKKLKLHSNIAQIECVTV